MIDKNVPLPKITTKKGVWASIAESMEVGDSYLDINGSASNSSGSKALNAFTQYGKKNGVKFTARKVEGGIRIWRVA